MKSDLQVPLTNLNPEGTRASLIDLRPLNTIDFGPEFGADWPLWAIEGLVSAEDLQLSSALCGKLTAWAGEFEAHVNHHLEWEPGFDHVSFNQRGDALAAEVALELGHDYSVRRTTGEALPWWQSTEEPTNPRAAAIFAEWLAEDQRQATALRADPSFSVAANVAMMFPLTRSSRRWP